MEISRIVHCLQKKKTRDLQKIIDTMEEHRFSFWTWDNRWSIGTLLVHLIAEKLPSEARKF